MKSPLISVVMPVYNGEKYLNEAIDSILNQTFTDFEFIIINDGSTDQTEEIILSYDDSRICYVKNEKNLQIVKTLNKGISLANGKYIARMDADDISMPERFERQVEFMENHSDIGVCGTWMQTIGDLNGVWKMPVTHEDIIVKMLFHSCLMHPTVFIRMQVLSLNNMLYDEAFSGTEDYDLWLRLSQVTKFSNIPKILLSYRINNMSDQRSAYKKKQRDQANKLRERYLKDNGIICNETELTLHNDLATSRYNATEGFALDSKQWLLNITFILGKENKLIEKACKKHLTEKLYQVCCFIKSDVKVFTIFLDFLKLSKNRAYILKYKLYIKTLNINLLWLK